MKISRITKVYTRGLLALLSLSGLMLCSTFTYAGNVAFVDVDNDGIYSAKDIALTKGDFFKSVVNQTYVFNTDTYKPSASLVIPSGYIIKQKGTMPVKISAAKNIIMQGAICLDGVNQSLELVAGGNLLVSGSKIKTSGTLSLSATGNKAILTAVKARFKNNGDIKIKSYDMDVTYSSIKSNFGTVLIESLNTFNGEHAILSAENAVIINLNSSDSSASVLNFKKGRIKSHDIKMTAANTTIRLDQSHLSTTPSDTTNGSVRMVATNISNFSMIQTRIDTTILGFNVQMNGNTMTEPVQLSDAKIDVISNNLGSAFDMSFSLLPSSKNFLINAQGIKIMCTGLTVLSANSTSATTLDLSNARLMVLNQQSAIADITVNVTGDVIVKSAYIVDPIAPTFVANKVIY
jgi:hypothetical protein